MIRFNDRFAFERDRYQWTLFEFYEGKDKKTHQPKIQRRESYHPNLAQVVGAILDRSAGDCESLDELRGLMADAVKHLTVYAKKQVAA